MAPGILNFEETAQPQRHRRKGTEDYHKQVVRQLLERATPRTADEAFRDTYRKALWRVKRRQKFFGGIAEVHLGGQGFEHADRIPQPEQFAVVFGVENEERLSSVEDRRRFQEEMNQLDTKSRLLEHQLHCDRPYLQVFRLGAASLLLAVLSILVWFFTGVGVPFHPVFAAATIPAAMAVVVMAFLIKPKEQDASKG